MASPEFHGKVVDASTDVDALRGFTSPENAVTSIDAIAESLGAAYEAALATVSKKDDLLVEDLIRKAQVKINGFIDTTPGASVDVKRQLKNFLPTKIRIMRTLATQPMTSIQTSIAEKASADLDTIATTLRGFGSGPAAGRVEAAKIALKKRVEDGEKLLPNLSNVGDKDLRTASANLRRELPALGGDQIIAEDWLNRINVLIKDISFIAKFPDPTAPNHGLTSDRTSLDKIGEFIDTLRAAHPDQEKIISELDILASQVLHEYDVTSTGARTNPLIRDLLRPSIDTGPSGPISGDLEGPAQQFLGNFIGEINRVNAISLTVAESDPTLWPGMLEAADRQYLENFKRRLVAYGIRQNDLASTGGIIDTDDLRKINELVNYTNEYVLWVQNVLDTTDVTKKTAKSSTGASPETGVDSEPTPENYLDAFRKYYVRAQAELVEKVKTNIQFSNFTPALTADYNAYQAQKEAIKKETNPDKKKLYDDYTTLMDNILSTWEYSYNSVKSQKAGLVHRKEVVEIYVDPDRWRQVFDRYQLVEYEHDASGKLKGDYEAKIDANGEQIGAFWDMWRIAIEVSVNPANEEERKFKYGDDIANNVGKYYDFVIEKYLKTAPGKKFREQFKDANLFELTKEQVKQMFDLGCLFDEIYATQAAWGGSISHETTKIDIGDGKTVDLWAAIRPIENASYKASNTVDAMTHEVMNISMTPLKSLKTMYAQDRSRSRAAEEHQGVKMPKGAAEMHEQMELYVDCSVDEEKVLGKFVKPDSFPNFAKSVLQYGLSRSERYFSVDVPGWAWMWQKLYEPFTGELSQDAAFQAIAKWSKDGLGRAKLIKGAIDKQVFVDMTNLYLVRVFHAYKDNPVMPAAKKGILGGLFGNSTRETRQLRKRSVEGIEKATTVNYFGSDGPEFKRLVLELLGAEFKYTNAEIRGMESKLARLNADKAAALKVKDTKKADRLKEEIQVQNDNIKNAKSALSHDAIEAKTPDLLVPEMRRNEITRYVEYLWHHHAYQDLLEKGYETWEKVKSSLSWKGLVDHVHSPYSVVHEDKKPAK